MSSVICIYAYTYVPTHKYIWGNFWESHVFEYSSSHICVKKQNVLLLIFVLIFFISASHTEIEAEVISTKTGPTSGPQDISKTLWHLFESDLYKHAP